MTTVVERRRFALSTTSGRYDLAVDRGARLGDTLRRGGMPVDDGRHVVLGPDGVAVPSDALIGDLVDGGLYSLVDTRASTVPRRGRRGADGRAEAGSARAGAAWWSLTVAAVLVLAVVAVGTDGADGVVRGMVAAGAALAAVVLAIVPMRPARPAHPASSVAVLVPIGVLAFGAGALAAPAALGPGADGAAFSGALACAIAGAVVAATAAGAATRAAAATGAATTGVVAVVIGLTLLLGWHVAAVLLVGIAPLAARALPNTFVRVPDGAFIDYGRFLRDRWTVRGPVPETPGAVHPADARGLVDTSVARMATAASVGAVTVAAAAPFAFLRPWGDDPVVVVAGIVLLVLSTTALLLSPRHVTSRFLRWTVRSAAAVIAAIGTGVAVARLDPEILSIVGSAGVVAGILVGLAALPIARGGSSLAWSRTADVVEWLAVVLALPAALLFGDVLSLLRGMMA